MVVLLEGVKGEAILHKLNEKGVVDTLKHPPFYKVTILILNFSIRMLYL